jgi:hypothetical protein
MKNVEYEIKGKIMTIKLDITQSFGPSKSGKSEIIASTEGNKKITVEGQDIYLGLNCYKKIEKAKEE